MEKEGEAPDEPTVDNPVVPHSPVVEAQIECMENKGWTPEAQFGGGMNFGDVPPEQAERLQEDATLCSQDTGWGSFDRFSAEQVSQLYDLEVEAHECFLEHDYASPPPPSRETYIDTFQTADQYYAFGDLSPGPTVKIQSICPPPTWFPPW